MEFEWLETLFSHILNKESILYLIFYLKTHTYFKNLQYPVTHKSLELKCVIYANLLCEYKLQKTFPIQSNYLSLF